MKTRTLYYYATHQNESGWYPIIKVERTVDVDSPVRRAISKTQISTGETFATLPAALRRTEILNKIAAAEQRYDVA